MTRSAKAAAVTTPPAAAVRKRLPRAPTDRASLARWLKRHLGITIPDIRICPNHQTPMDYLAASFLDDGTPKRADSRSGDPGRSSDLLVWANRGGGKTMLAAIASLLEAAYRAPVHIRILGGSFDQSDRLAEHLRGFLDTPLGEALSAKVNRERIVLANHADIRMLAQSERAVRGQHVQRIRCDELELFDQDVWSALQFVTRSTDRLRGGVEVFSTMHRPGGLMSRLVRQIRQEAPEQEAALAGGLPAGEAAAPAPAPARKDAGGPDRLDGAFRLLTWCLWEVIEKCPPERPCHGCALADDCAGRARQADGFFRIDDAIAIKRRSSRAAWDSEMLCTGPHREGQVYPEFDEHVHVSKCLAPVPGRIYCGIDPGHRSPFACLWVQVVDGERVHVLGEYERAGLTVPNNARAVLRRTAELFGQDARIATAFVDPAGASVEGTSGKSAMQMLRAEGIDCASTRSGIVDGIELIRAALDPACDEPPRLTIHARCEKLIEAFESYHYPAPGAKGNAEKPVKDGPDHCLDALRYFFVGRMQPGGSVRMRNY